MYNTGRGDAIMTNPHILTEMVQILPGEETPTHSHEQYTIGFMLEGTGDFYVESTIYSLTPGDLLLTKKAESHFARPPQAEPYQLLTVHFTEDALLGSHRTHIQTFLDTRPLGQFNLYSAAQFKDTHWKYYLMQMYENRENEDLSSLYLSVLLTELMRAYPTICQPSSHRTDQLFAIISYINENLSQPMSVESLCQRFFISRSQINRLFRKMTGSSVWDYVVSKRLMYAKTLLEAGETPAVACHKCGFNDYSPFYRAYKTRYGVSPRLHKQKAG